MRENTNQAIAINSLILYVRLAIVSACGLLHTRFGLEALGIPDFGLFSVVAGIISFVAIINTIMIATSNRFMAIAIGKGDIDRANQTFNVNLAIHVMIAMLTLAVAYPIGHWYISHFINYTGNMDNVYKVFDMSIIAAVISFIGVPYNGLLLARERFFVFCSTDVLSSIAKVIFTYFLIYHFENKLFLFTLTTAFLTASTTVVFITYCHTRFRETTRLHFIRDKRQYLDVLNFSASMGIGAIAFVAKAQGSALVVNMFFTTMTNSALAVANSVNNVVSLFAQNIHKPISPQIVKSYATNDMERSGKLVCMSSKLTCLIMILVSIPFLIIPETIFGLWLKDTPEHTVAFTRLLIIDALIMSLNAGVPDLVFATGKVRNYQLAVNGLLCCSVIFGYQVLKAGMAAEALFVCYIVFSGIVCILRPILLSRITQFNISDMVKKVYKPVFLIILLLLPVFALRTVVNEWALLFISETYYIVLLFLIGLTEREREYVLSHLRARIQR